MLHPCEVDSVARAQALRGWDDAEFGFIADVLRN